MNKPGELWEIVPFYRVQPSDHKGDCAYLTIRQVGSTDVWDCLRLDTGGIEVITLSSKIYRRVA